MTSNPSQPGLAPKAAQPFMKRSEIVPFGLLLHYLTDSDIGSTIHKLDPTKAHPALILDVTMVTDEHNRETGGVITLAPLSSKGHPGWQQTSNHPIVYNLSAQCTSVNNPDARTRSHIWIGDPFTVQFEFGSVDVVYKMISMANHKTPLGEAVRRQNKYGYEMMAEWYKFCGFLPGRENNEISNRLPRLLKTGNPPTFRIIDPLAFDNNPHWMNVVPPITPKDLKTVPYTDPQSPPMRPSRAQYAIASAPQGPSGPASPPLPYSPFPQEQWNWQQQSGPNVPAFSSGSIADTAHLHPMYYNQQLQQPYQHQSNYYQQEQPFQDQQSYYQQFQYHHPPQQPHMQEYQYQLHPYQQRPASESIFVPNPVAQYPNSHQVPYPLNANSAVFVPSGQMNFQPSHPQSSSSYPVNTAQDFTAPSQQYYGQGYQDSQDGSSTQH
ncbi:unnamed protein product [Mycena citricolor]|uniref:Uncharacterized protein n=1 Tax=Mycena citricolor TaxID=2018698 RepID=A0AAD2HAB6_9AGAR|nr:unnamed protein product [Mycena citricolor]